MENSKKVCQLNDRFQDTGAHCVELILRMRNSLLKLPDPSGRAFEMEARLQTASNVILSVLESAECHPTLRDLL